MEVAKIVLEFLRVLIWPGTVLTLGLLFRIEIKKLLTRLRKAALPGGVSLELEDQIQQVRILSEKVESEPPPSNREKAPGIPLTEANARAIQLGLRPTASGLDMSYYRNLAISDPVLALAGVRIELETLARNLAQGFKLEVGSNERIGRVLSRLRDAGAITSDQMKLAQNALSVGNLAMHGEPISVQQAQDVIDSVSVLVKDYLAWLSWGFPDNWKPSQTR